MYEPDTIGQRRAETVTTRVPAVSAATIICLPTLTAEQIADLRNGVAARLGDLEVDVDLAFFDLDAAPSVRHRA